MKAPVRRGIRPAKALTAADGTSLPRTPIGAGGKGFDPDRRDLLSAYPKIPEVPPPVSFKTAVTIQQVPRVLGEALRFAPVVAKQAPLGPVWQRVITFRSKPRGLRFAPVVAGQAPLAPGNIAKRFNCPRRVTVQRAEQLQTASKCPDDRYFLNKKTEGQTGNPAQGRVQGQAAPEGAVVPHHSGEQIHERAAQ